MKILYFDLDIPYLIKNDGTPTGGAAVEWASWLKGFKEAGHEASILSWVGANKFTAPNNEFNIVEGIELSGGIKILKWFTHRFLKLYKAISKNKPDLLVKECADAYTGILAIVAKLLKIKFLYRVANDLDTDERYKKKLSLFDRKLFEVGLFFSDYILCQNAYQEKNLKNKFPNKKIKVLYNPLAININNDEILANHRSYVAWVGIFQYQKNLPALYEIAKRQEHTHFKIAGKEDPGIDTESKTALEHLKKLKNVEFMGFIKREEVNSFLGGAYCLLNTSHFEGFSNTFLEAWKVGTPVISTKNVNPDGLISKFNLGVIAENYSEIPQILSEYIQEKKYEDYSIICLKYVKENHNPKILAQKFISFVE